MSETIKNKMFYDELDRTAEVWYTVNAHETMAYSYEYDANGNLCKFNDYLLKK